MISARYAPMLCVALAVPLVPTLIHTYAGLEVHDGRRLEAIVGPMGGYQVTPTRRDRSWGRQNFNTDDWLERRYRSDGEELVATIVRSYDPKTLYHHPELACAYGTPFDRHSVERFPRRPDIPIHVLRTSTGRRAAAFYALHYDTGFVAEPLLFQLRTAGALLFSPRRPMTLFFVHDPAIDARADLGAMHAVALLYDVVDRFIASAPSDGAR